MIDNISDEFSYGPPFGLKTIVVVAVARDENGAIYQIQSIRGTQGRGDHA